MKEHRENLCGTANKCRILIGAGALLVGTLVYLVDRHPQQTYFVSNSAVDISFHHLLPNLFGPIGNSLPAFIHVFSFILITAGLMACRKKGFIVICLAWLLVDSAFELSQKYKSLAHIVPDWFAGIPLLENSENYILHGTFDYFDMAGIVLGASVAFIVLVKTENMEKGWSHEKKKK
ncbi:MAG: hypothetical protein AMJ54_15230 [Deltaproteobacteria bacterium SG8_13]|nr:MAG: hypothetical protein AMJ54_15230 [Deltaproteobacteria bacterium SG8_13]